MAFFIVDAEEAEHRVEVDAKKQAAEDRAKEG